MKWYSAAIVSVSVFQVVRVQQLLLRALDHQVVEDGDVTSGVDIRGCGLQSCIGDDALVQLDAGTADRLRVVVEADSIGKDVEVHAMTVDGFCGEPAVLAAEPLDLVGG